jgi:hypothetical protein
MAADDNNQASPTLNYFSPSPVSAGQALAALTIWIVVTGLATPLGLLIGVAGQFAAFSTMAGDSGYAPLENKIGLILWLINTPGILLGAPRVVLPVLALPPNDQSRR